MFIWELCYNADVVSLLSSGIRWCLNYMLEVCEFFAEDNYIIFNVKKTVCIKFDRVVLDCENSFLIVNN